jgi:hypothetical protein
MNVSVQKHCTLNSYIFGCGKVYYSNTVLHVNSHKNAHVCTGAPVYIIFRQLEVDMKFLISKL